ncbi:MAG: IS1634 family transposase [Actinomycetota bacterium]|nr:IS1634 family transposase [Actinomycetota bacterium]
MTGIVDDVVGARRGDAAASVGTYIALAVANRVVDPCSKLAFSEWWTTTAGDRIVKLAASALDHRRFWDAMDVISESQLQEIERRIVAGMVESFGVDLSGLVLDMTNFATYIDSANEAAPIAQRGHAKQNRTDLRLVGLGLVVSIDGGIPLVSHAYAGNRPDVTQFPKMVKELAARFATLDGDTGELTLVYDAGQDSADNQALMEGSPLHFVGSLPPSDHRDLLAVRTERYGVVDDEALPGLSAFETTKVVFGVERRVVITHSANLHAKQSRGFDQTLSKARRQLCALAARLARGHTRRPAGAVDAEIANILKAKWLSRVISTTLAGESPAELRLTWRTKPQARAALEAELFGKRILFTDRDHWTIAQVVAGYRSQSHVEADFRQMKDPKVVSFSPMFHWTDHKIRVHVCCCVLALMVARLMVREAERHGMALSVALAPRNPRRHPRDRSALPRRTGTPPRPADAHRDRSHPATPLRPLRPRRLRPETMTTTTARPPAWDILEQALRQRRPVRLTYHGRQRTVCPHALGWKNSRAMVLAYQIGGQTSTGAPPADRQQRWRNLFVDDIAHAGLANSATTWQTANNYNASHPFNSIDQLGIAITPRDPASTNVR